MVKSLKSIPYGNVGVIVNEDGVKLVSYSTVVVTIDSDGWMIVNGLYSMTTRKHISAFMKEYTKYDYYMAKQLYNDRLTLNLYTSEIKDL